MGLTWHSPYEYLNTPVGDCAVLEAAGVKGTVKWKLTGDKGWKQEAKKHIAEACREPKMKKARKDDEELPSQMSPSQPMRRWVGSGKSLWFKKKI